MKDLSRKTISLCSLRLCGKNSCKVEKTTETQRAQSENSNLLELVLSPSPNRLKTLF